MSGTQNILGRKDTGRRQKKIQKKNTKKEKKTYKKQQKITKNTKTPRKHPKNHKKTPKNTHNTTLKNKTMSITDLIKKQRYTQVLAKGKQFLILIRHSQSYVIP